MSAREINIAVATPVMPSPSETFLRAHLELLPAKVHHFHSFTNRGYFPIVGPDEKALSSKLMPVIFSEYILDRITGRGYYFREKALVSYIKENKIKALLAEYGPTAAHLQKACLMADIPLIAHFHGRDAYHYDTLKKNKGRYDFLFKNAAAVVAVSRDMQKQLSSIGCPESVQHLNPCCPNNKNYSFTEVENNPPRYVSIGRFTGKKAPDLTIRAFEKVVQEIPDAHLTMVAEGPLWEESKQLAKTLNLQDKIDFPGWMKPLDISALFKQCRIFVQHSIRSADGDSEGTPVSVLEAMLTGLPVVSTRHAGIKDVVEEEKSGYLVDEKDWESMATHMIELGKNPTKCAEMGRYGNQVASKQYSMEKHIDKLWSVIQSTI